MCINNSTTDRGCDAVLTESSTVNVTVTTFRSLTTVPVNAWQVCPEDEIQNYILIKNYHVQLTRYNPYLTSVQCLHNYHLETGNLSIICLPSGQWSNFPYCEVDYFKQKHLLVSGILFLSFVVPVLMLATDFYYFVKRRQNLDVTEYRTMKADWILQAELIKNYRRLSIIPNIATLTSRASLTSKYSSNVEDEKPLKKLPSIVVEPSLPRRRSASSKAGSKYSVSKISSSSAYSASKSNASLKTSSVPTSISLSTGVDGKVTMERNESQKRGSIQKAQLYLSL